MVVATAWVSMLRTAELGEGVRRGGMQGRGWSECGGNGAPVAWLFRAGLKELGEGWRALLRLAGDRATKGEAELRAGWMDLIGGIPRRVAAVVGLDRVRSQ